MEKNLKKFLIRKAAVFSLIIALAITTLTVFVPEKTTVEEIKESLPAIERISYKTFDKISLEYKLINNESVELTYNDKGDVVEVYERDIDERYVVNNNPHISEKSLHEDIHEYTKKRNDIMIGLDKIAERRAAIAMIYFTTVFVIVLFAFDAFDEYTFSSLSDK